LALCAAIERPNPGTELVSFSLALIRKSHARAYLRAGVEPVIPHHRIAARRRGRELAYRGPERYASAATACSRWRWWRCPSTWRALNW